MDRRIGKITLYRHLDVEGFNAWLTAGDTLLLEVERRYPVDGVGEAVTAVLPAQFTGGTEDYMEALTLALDAATFALEQNCVVFKVVYNAGTKAYDLTQSYVRTGIDSADTDPVTTGQVLKAEFTTPGLPESIRTVISLPFGEPITLADDDALKDVGLSMASGGTGSGFTLSNAVPYTVRFFRPDLVTENYVIDWEPGNTIITP